MKIRNFVIVLLIMGIGLLILSCSRLDVVARGGLKSLDALTEKLPATEAADGWRLDSPTGGESLFISSDFSRDDNDLVLALQLDDFTGAGFRPGNLKADAFSPALWFWEPAGNLLVISFPVSQKDNKGNRTAPEAFVINHPDRIGFHKQFDHFGFDTGAGTMVEWAKDLSANDKDLVFVLPPEPFIEAGLDPVRLKSWVYAPVTVMDKKGKPVEVTKLLMPYNID